MKKSLLLVGALLFASSQAQDGAAQIFERAKAAHGGAALETMTGYRDVGLINYYNEKGEVSAKIEYKQVIQFSSSTVRFEYSQNKKVVQILQTTPSQAWGWTEQSGVVRLPPAQAKIVRDSLNQGLFAFRAKATDLKDLKIGASVKLGNTEGTVLNFSLGGAINAPVVAIDGTIVGGQTMVDTAVLQSVSSDFRTVGGIKIAFASRTTLGAQLAFDQTISSAEVNPSLSDADFAQPK
jgi:hypothetical protein